MVNIILDNQKCKSQSASHLLTLYSVCIVFHHFSWWNLFRQSKKGGWECQRVYLHDLASRTGLDGSPFSQFVKSHRGYNFVAKVITTTITCSRSAQDLPPQLSPEATHYHLADILNNTLIHHYTNPLDNLTNNSKTGHQIKRYSEYSH